jgi:hypothetical protein
MQTAVTHGVPQHPTDLPRGYIPMEACEKDFRDITTGRSRRLRMVRIKNHDLNSTRVLVEDLGPPTGEPGVYVPCEGAVEMAHLHELLDQAVRNRAAWKKRQAELLPKRHEIIRLQLLDYAYQAIEWKAGRSTFGPYQNTERTSS